MRIIQTVTMKNNQFIINLKISFIKFLLPRNFIIKKNCITKVIQIKIINNLKITLKKLKFVITLMNISITKIS